MTALMLVVITACSATVVAIAQPHTGATTLNGAEMVHYWNWLITDNMVDEQRTPCNISRVYAYCNIAAYEAARPGFAQCRSFEGQLTDLKGLPQPDKSKTYDWRIAVNAAYKTVGDKWLFRTARPDSLFDANMDQFRAEKVPADVIDRSRAYGESIGKAVIAWSVTDGYVKNTARARYVIPKGTGLWEPTPPDFPEPIDPFWKDVRPFALKKNNQFKVDPPIKFSTQKGSDFYKQATEVYTTFQNLTDSQKLVAKFWDCNPIHSIHLGHTNLTTRQISPAGHWITITKFICRQKNLPMMESLESYALVSVSIADAFLSCWTEKYTVNGIRPVTYINRYIDSNWIPYIQTPPFPEYASGHSTISAAAGTMLTHLFGEMAFDDSTEIYLQMPVRHFPNFMTAAREAAVSRFWGGIHYRRSNEVGTKNGIEVATYIAQKIHTRV